MGVSPGPYEAGGIVQTFDPAATAVAAGSGTRSSADETAGWLFGDRWYSRGGSSRSVSSVRNCPLILCTGVIGNDCEAAGEQCDRGRGQQSQ